MPRIVTLEMTLKKYFGAIFIALLHFQSSSIVLSLNNGLALTPPMGWRTWNAYSCDVNQSIVEKIMDLMVKTHSFKSGTNVSLFQLGYKDVGLDDCWQNCGAGYKGGFHTKTGDPIVDESKFPDLGQMVEHGHKKNLTVGWYGNNCVCSEHGFSDDEMNLQMEGDVKATMKYMFDGIKLDGCGQKLDLQKYSDLFDKYGHKVVIENCHWGNDLRTPLSCPYHFARSSQDIIRTWEGFYLNLQTMARANGLSGPGCWAYPDMLEVGNMNGSFSETRAHFGAWCITSSPLVLSFDLTNNKVLEEVWSIISNREAISVNQAWNGDAGRLLYSWDPRDEISQDLPYYVWILPCDDFEDEQQGWTLKSNGDDGELRWIVDDSDLSKMKHNVNFRFMKFPENDENLDTMNGGSIEMCMKMQQNVVPSFLQMWPCDEPDFNSTSTNSTMVTIKYNMTSGQLQSTSSDSGSIQCLTPFSYDEANNAAAGLVLQECVENEKDRNLHVKQRFHITTSPDPTKSRVLTGVQTTMCLALKSTAPLNANKMQMWAKLLPVEEEEWNNDINANHNNDKTTKKRAAVFIINADQKQTHSISINNLVLAKIFQIKGVPKGVIKIKDIWRESQPSNLGEDILAEIKAQRILKELFVDQYFSWSVQIPPRDSQFFILELIHKK